MIGLTDLAVKELLETRFRMPSIWTSETVAVMTRGDERFRKFPSLAEKRIKDGKEIIFPFCAFIRSQGQPADDRFNLAMAISGYKTGIEFRDRTRTYKVRMIPVQYPYMIQYYCDEYDQTILLEKKYWGLKIEPLLPLKFPLDSSPDQSFNTNAEIIQLDGFEVANTDVVYERGRYYTGAMGFTVLTHVAEGYEVPLIQKIEVGIYDKDFDHYLESFAKDQKFWGPKDEG
jgi:hypothetical protein